MKQVHIIPTVILGIAVLVAAYAVGLLIKQARMDVPDLSQLAAEPNDANIAPVAADDSKAGTGEKAPTPDGEASAGDEQSPKVAEANEPTDGAAGSPTDTAEQRRPGRGGPGQIPHLSPEQLASAKDMSEEERQAFRTQMRSTTTRSATTTREYTSRPRPPESDPNAEGGPPAPN